MEPSTEAIVRLSTSVGILLVMALWELVAPVREQIRPRRARRILRQAGFRDITFLRERPRVYVFEARGQRGYRRIAVNKFNGNIVWRWGRRG